MTAWARRRIVVLGVVGVVLLAGCGDDDDETTGSSTTTTAVPATSTTTLTATTTTAPGTTTSAVTDTTMGSVPVAVTAITARPGGGSGEVAVTWGAVAGATGYRVSRSSAPSGPYSVSVDLNLATAEVTVADSVANLFSPGSAEYFPVLTFQPGDPLPNDFEYIDLGGLEPRYFRVVAYNAAGDGPPSVVACGSAPGGVAC